MRRNLLLLSLCVLFLAGCKTRQYMPADAKTETPKADIIIEKETEPIVIETEPVTEAEPDDRTVVDGKIKSYLTGEMVDVAVGTRRPIAIMMSNDKESLPQYGINRAGVVYEAPVEGEMNRYMAVLEDYDGLERIGSVRSCRTYYTYFAREFDAIYVHYGQSTFAKPYLNNVDNINGIEGIGETAFYRSKDKKRPHNAYASYDRIQSAIQRLGYSQEYAGDYSGHFQFAKSSQQTELSSGEVLDAYKVVPGYTYNKPWFEYNEEDGLYYRYQYGGVHSGDEGPVAVKNLIIQYCPAGYYASTEYRNINVHEGVWGYYITGGKAERVDWRKDGEFGVTRYYDNDGNEIRLNPGKTWICIMTGEHIGRISITGKE